MDNTRLVCFVATLGQGSVEGWNLDSRISDPEVTMWLLGFVSLILKTKAPSVFLKTLKSVTFHLGGADLGQQECEKREVKKEPCETRRSEVLLGWILLHDGPVHSIGRTSADWLWEKWSRSWVEGRRQFIHLDPFHFLSPLVKVHSMGS